MEGVPIRSPPFGQADGPSVASGLRLQHALHHLGRAIAMEEGSRHGCVCRSQRQRPHDWCTCSHSRSVSNRVFFLSWPFSRYRHALIRECPPERCHPSSLVPEVLNSCFEVLLLPLRPFPPLVHAGCLLVVLFLPDAVCLFVRSASWLAPPPPAKGEQMPGWIPCAT